MSDIKYTIIKDEKSCFGPAWSVNGKWLEEGEDLANNEELMDYLIDNLKEYIKKGHSDFESLLSIYQYDDYEADKDRCETCGHYGGKTTWKV